MKKFKFKNYSIATIILGMALVFSNSCYSQRDQKPVPPEGQATGPVQENTFVPDFFLMPNDSLTSDLPASRRVSVKTVSNGAGASLRLINTQNNVRGQAAAKILAQDGIVKTGDVLLSFRPRWGNTLGYANLQLGISHAGVAIVTEKNGQKIVKTIEAPLSYSSYLDNHHHYDSLHFIHVIRPNFTDQQRENLKEWAKKVWAKASRFDFHSDYATPLFQRGTGVTSPEGVVQLIADIATGRTRSRMAAYCSEFAWAFLGLATADPNNYRPGDLSMIFNPMVALDLDTSVPGLMEGPSNSLRQSGMSDEDRLSVLTKDALVNKIENPAQLRGIMSSGHQAVARAFSPLIGIQNQWYADGERASLTTPDGRSVPANMFFNSQVKQNYSPTSFMIRAAAGLGSKYVGTISFKNVD